MYITIEELEKMLARVKELGGAYISIDVEIDESCPILGAHVENIDFDIMTPENIYMETVVSVEGD